MPCRPLRFSATALAALAGTSFCFPSFPPAKGPARAQHGSLARLRTTTPSSLPLSLRGAGQRRCREARPLRGHGHQPSPLGSLLAPGPPQSSPADPHRHSPGLCSTALPAPRESSPSLTISSRLCCLRAAGVHVHQELGQAPHAGTKDGTAAHATARWLHALQVLTQQPGQGADTAGVCGAKQAQSRAPQPRAWCGRAPGSAGYLGW